MSLRRGNPRAINGKVDNMLWVTTDGRKAALWLGLHGIQEAYPAKLDAIATEMAKIYHRWQENASYLSGPYKSLQIGFCDLGTPNRKKGSKSMGKSNASWWRKAFRHTASALSMRSVRVIAPKPRSLNSVATGEVAILLGSTAKLGTGTNIQTRCAAIHHCDAPWRPDEVEQREGRGQRPGNLYPVVEIFYYVQRRTFDAYSWQILANKAKFFNQMRSSTVISREMAYSDDSSLTYGQVKAAATGDILLLEHANVSLSVDAFSRLHASFERARERDQQEANRLRRKVKDAETVLKRYEQVEQQTRAYTGPHPFMTTNRVLLETKEARRECLAREVTHAIKNKPPNAQIGSWQGVPIFVTIKYLAENPYTLAIADPYTGIELSCHPLWFEEGNQWRIDNKLEEFFRSLAEKIEAERTWISNHLQKADEFEVQAKTIFPQHDPWQVALARKGELDRYIDAAASAHSQEDFQRLAQMRQHLLETAPKELMERPKPKNTATFVLPPRNPNAQEEAVSTTQIEITETQTPEQTIEEMARTIQQSVVGSRAAVSFGDLEQIAKNKKATKGKRTLRTAATENGSHPKASNERRTCLYTTGLTAENKPHEEESDPDGSTYSLVGSSRDGGVNPRTCCSGHAHFRITRATHPFLTYQSSRRGMSQHVPLLFFVEKRNKPCKSPRLSCAQLTSLRVLEEICAVSPWQA